ncbi:MAG: ribosome small subunit-dependent GTPase A [Limnochordia bacterium]|jgi:ribosome biogenesis GTPase|nr:ribosome small subunit-dependent GTPase A [Limnochordia bacterium]MDD2629106.1 ribosome small subunit-dependent GTPase A [Limnochordia bacterium]MDD4517292.1 ribosome small subunit-dependent GTPase A [Limnochordia bacterium]
MQKGIVIRAIGGYYFVQTEQGQVYQCLLRGKLKRQHQRILVGDWVHARPTSSSEGVIEEVLPRRLELSRPPVANLDILVVVNSVVHPSVNLVLLDRILLAARQQGLRCILCWNKVDLEQEDPQLSGYIQAYLQQGYDCVRTSALTGEGIDRLIELLSGSMAVLTGDSGVGKSALLNRVLGQTVQEEGDISQRLKRGRHTTREVVLYPLGNGGFIADTPGFTRMPLVGVEPVVLEDFFFREYFSGCYYSDCRHRNEPECAVKEAVAKGDIPSWRYDNYLFLLDELVDSQEGQWK